MNMIKALFDAYNSSESTKQKKKDWAFQELEQYPMLFSSDHLNNLYNQATKKEDFESILDHMYQHEATEIESYSNIEEKIINKYWG